jgi:hypothetical protein
MTVRNMGNGGDGMAENPRDEFRESRPTPDPTELTNALVTQATTVLQDLFDAKLAQRDQRMDASAEAVKLLQNARDLMPALIKDEVHHLERLVAGRMDGFDTRLADRDTQGERTARQNEAAIKAALDAAEKAVGKQQEASEKAIAKAEDNTIKQVDGVTTLVASNATAAAREMGDIKERLTRMEAALTGLITTVAEIPSMRSDIGLVKQGIASTVGEKAGGQQNTAAIIAGGGFIITLILAGIAVAAALAGGN